MKKLFAILLALIMIISVMPTAFAVDSEAVIAANCLNALGLFDGTGTTAEGKPIYELDRAPSRHEAVTMLVRLLGKETEAKNGTWDTPFTDVAEWAKPYVGYAYANGLTSGTGDTTFGGNATVTASQYLTFVLRALGYDSDQDFRWDKAWELSDQIGLTDGRYINAKTFLRGDVTIVSRSAMDVKQKDSEWTLAEKLIAEDVFTADEFEQATRPPEILKEPTEKPVEVEVTFAINGEMLPWDWHYQTEAGTYVVTPYFNGQPFDEYEVETEWGGGTVYKNGDGTFTVDFPAKESCSITMYYDFEVHENVDENGEVTTSISRTKRNLDFDVPIPDSGFAITRKGWTLLPGISFGDNTKPYYVLDVYYNGERVSDYTVTTSGSSITASIQADGTLLLMKNSGGKTQFTISYQGESATFGAWGL